MLFNASGEKQRIKDYWAKEFIIETPVFSQVMARDRYLEILRYLHFAENTNVNKNNSSFKIRCIVDHFKSVFKSSLYPFQNLVIDESLMLFKGRISFRQYIPSKRHRFGMNFFVLVDCETGYILDFIIYTRSSTTVTEFDSKVGKSGNIVLTLTEPCWNKGHRLYTCPLLYGTMFAKKTNSEFGRDALAPCQLVWNSHLLRARLVLAPSAWPRSRDCTGTI